MFGTMDLGDYLVDHDGLQLYFVVHINRYSFQPPEACGGA